jgi:hypothetical protein
MLACNYQTNIKIEHKEKNNDNYGVLSSSFIFLEI